MDAANLYKVHIRMSKISKANKSVTKNNAQQVKMHKKEMQPT